MFHPLLFWLDTYTLLSSRAMGRGQNSSNIRRSSFVRVLSRIKAVVSDSSWMRWYMRIWGSYKNEPSRRETRSHACQSRLHFNELENKGMGTWETTIVTEGQQIDEPSERTRLRTNRDDWNSDPRNGAKSRRFVRRSELLSTLPSSRSSP